MRVSWVTPKRATNSCMRRARKRRMASASMLRSFTRVEMSLDPAGRSACATVWRTVKPGILALGFLDFFNKCWNYFEQVTYDSVIGYLEDGRVGILVDGDDGFGAFHAHQMLDGAGNSHGQINFGRYGLPGAAHLALHRQPAAVTDGARSREFGA